ncbi:hypothetical protein QFC20_002196 [Naganishia adeliensis]|uniref:Uncharacterized protein n=1 Tax=Naganishia adeliensis TaxID=92952 RepID=A0ACC2WLS9_9TREE|nr:hypothetical protein QFC20_002196 [Naganishia adeliensis]
MLDPSSKKQYCAAACQAGLLKNRLVKYTASAAYDRENSPICCSGKYLPLHGQKLQCPSSGIPHYDELKGKCPNSFIHPEEYYRRGQPAWRAFLTFLFLLCSNKPNKPATTQTADFACQAGDAGE